MSLAMTKQIRIENADTSRWPVRVTVENKQADGSWKVEKTVQIDHPTQQTEQYLTSSRRLIVEELAAEVAPTEVEAKSLNA
jgi:dihydroneopterin aldolase